MLLPPQDSFALIGIGACLAGFGSTLTGLAVLLFVLWATRRQAQPVRDETPSDNGVLPPRKSDSDPPFGSPEMRGRR